ncbi:MAG: HIT family protein, partial [Anaerolineae bacterium]
EQAEHPHVHFHIVPRMAGQPDDRRGPRVFGYLGVPEDERVSEEKMNEIAAGVGQYLATNNSNR